MVNARVVGNWRHLTLTLRTIFVFLAQAILLQWFDLATSFLVREYIFRISRPGSGFKGIGARHYYFKFSICCFIPKLERLECDRGQKVGQNFALIDPL